METVDNVYATVIADSVNEDGDRLTTMEVQGHRFILSEFNTHRRFSRNSASSRAIPFGKQIERMDKLGLAYPLAWPAEQRGMQGGEELSDELIRSARDAWDQAARVNVQVAQALNSAGVHKSVVNRLLEPFMWHKIIVSSTEWENFFSQRCSPLAQPEIRVLAERMREALHESTPVVLPYGEWHTPYIDETTLDQIRDGFSRKEHVKVAIRVSAARCARVSYLTHNGIRDLSADIELYNRLTSADPPHWSPLEHVATPSYPDEGPVNNFTGWTQLRRLAAEERELKK